MKSLYYSSFKQIICVTALLRFHPHSTMQKLYISHKMLKLFLPFENYSQRTNAIVPLKVYLHSKISSLKFLTLNDIKLELQNLQINSHDSQCGNFIIVLRTYNSDFTWNQFWGFYKCKICHCNTFRGPEFWLLRICALFEGWNIPNQQNSELLKL